MNLANNRILKLTKLAQFANTVKKNLKLLAIFSRIRFIFAFHRNLCDIFLVAQQILLNSSLLLFNLRKQSPGVCYRRIAINLTVPNSPDKELRGVLLITVKTRRKSCY